MARNFQFRERDRSSQLSEGHAAAEDVSKCYASPKGFPRPLPGDQGRESQVQSWWITNREMGRTEKRSLGEFTSEESGWTSNVCWEALRPTSNKVTRDPWMSGFSLSKWETLDSRNWDPQRKLLSPKVSAQTYPRITQNLPGCLVLDK